MSGHSFEFGGDHKIVPIGSKGDDFAIIGANPDLFRAPAVDVPLSPESRKALDAGLASARRGEIEPFNLRPLNVLKAAKARLREVNKEINRLRKLEVERDELTRLISAAEQKPCAVVRNIAAKRG